MDLLKVIARYLKYEVEDPNRMNEGLLDSYMLLFDEYQNFFRNHKIEIPVEENKEEPEKVEDSKPEDSKVDTPDIYIKQEGANDSKDEENDDEGQNDQEMSHNPENIGESGATSNVAEADGWLSNNAIEDMENQSPEITVQDANLLDIDDGNNADTEGWPDDTPEEPLENYKNSFSRTKHADNKFVPDRDYEYDFDEDLTCMIYTGPDFKVGDMVDAIKIEPNTHANIQCWEQAQIIAEDMETYTIRFFRDDPLYDRQIKKEHYRTVLFKLETHTRENYWRYQNQHDLLGTLIDYYSIMYDCWCKAKVINMFTNVSETIDNVLLEVVEVPPMYKNSFFGGEDNKYPQLSVRSP
jgi:hypothetical protein